MEPRRSTVRASRSPKCGVCIRGGTPGGTYTLPVSMQSAYAPFPSTYLSSSIVRPPTDHLPLGLSAPRDGAMLGMHRFKDSPRNGRIVDTMQPEQPPKPTVLVLTTLIVVIGGLGTAALFSNIDPSVKPWLVGLAYLLVSAFALAAAGTLTSVRKKIQIARFNSKLRGHYGRLRMLGPFLGEVEKLDIAYLSLLTLFLTDESNRRNTHGQKAAYGIGLLNSTKHGSAKFRDAVLREARGLLAEGWITRVKTTSQLFHAVDGLCAFVETIGKVVEGLVEDVNRIGGTSMGSNLHTAYEVFRQDYAGFVDSLHRYLMENEVVFGKKIDFSPLRLPMMMTASTLG